MAPTFIRREVEDVLLKHDAILECSVVGRPHPEWGEEVVAFVIPKDARKIDVEDLDRLCLKHIARYKRPKRYIELTELPKNNYGKLLKTELRKYLTKVD